MISIVYKLQHTLFTESSCWLIRDAFIIVSHCDFWIDKSSRNNLKPLTAIMQRMENSSSMRLDVTEIYSVEKDNTDLMQNL